MCFYHCAQLINEEKGKIDTKIYLQQCMAAITCKSVIMLPCLRLAQKLLVSFSALLTLFMERLLEGIAFVRFCQHSPVQWRCFSHRTDSNEHQINYITVTSCSGLAQWRHSEVNQHSRSTRAWRDGWLFQSSSHMHTKSTINQGPYIHVIWALHQPRLSDVTFNQPFYGWIWYPWTSIVWLPRSTCKQIEHCTTYLQTVISMVISHIKQPNNCT